MFFLGFLAGVVASVAAIACICFSDRATNATISLIKRVRGNQ
jgi:hypothetical protein